MINHGYHFNKIIIGGNLNALFYSYKNNIPLLINKLYIPYRFEPDKKDLWNKLYFILSLSGLNILGDKAVNLRINEDQITATTNNSKVIKIKFDKAIIFDDDSVTGLPIPEKEENKFVVLDWMVAKSCMLHNKEKISTNHDFVKEIYFYPTDRTDGHYPNIKDLIVISYLTKEMLRDFDYSDVYARFKTEKLLKENGITGKKNGTQGDKQISYTLRLEVKKREIRKLKMNLYEDTDNIKFKYENELSKNISLCKYTNKLNNILNAL